jgi:hypothetical protein
MPVIRVLSQPGTRQGVFPNRIRCARFSRTDFVGITLTKR